MIFKELSVFMNFICWLWLFLLYRQVVSVVERKSWLIACLCMLNNRNIVSDVGLTSIQSVSVVVEFQNLPFLETQKGTCRMAQKGLDWIYLSMSDRS